MVTSTPSKYLTLLPAVVMVLLIGVTPAGAVFRSIVTACRGERVDFLLPGGERVCGRDVLDPETFQMVKLGTATISYIRQDVASYLSVNPGLVALNLEPGETLTLHRTEGGVVTSYDDEEGELLDEYGTLPRGVRVITVTILLDDDGRQSLDMLRESSSTLPPEAFVNEFASLLGYEAPLTQGHLQRMASVSEVLGTEALRLQTWTLHFLRSLGGVSAIPDPSSSVPVPSTRQEAEEEEEDRIRRSIVQKALLQKATKFVDDRSVKWVVGQHRDISSTLEVIKEQLGESVSEDAVKEVVLEVLKRMKTEAEERMKFFGDLQEHLEARVAELEPLPLVFARVFQSPAVRESLEKVLGQKK
jgi:hypothetical protein